MHIKYDWPSQFEINSWSLWIAYRPSFPSELKSCEELVIKELWWRSV
jgi:hypothetical protein